VRPSGLLIFGVAAGAVVGWLAFDPPSPRRAAAVSYEPPTGVTGAPGEGTCMQCHFGGEVFDGSLSISVPPEYAPGQSYTITVTLQDPGQSRWGFELIPLRRDESTQALVMAGSLTNLSLLTTIQETVKGQYVSHTSNEFDFGEPDGTFAGTPDGPVSWSFSWTAPQAGSDTVSFYAAGNAADNSGSPGLGDFIYTASAISVEGGPSPVSTTTWGKIKMKYR
jgi:hypothetical protein